jgi:predicted MFS family arabinose efflux permease
MVLDYMEKVRLISANARYFLAGGLFNGLGMSVFMLLFNLYLKEFGYSETSIGHILSAGALGAAVIAVPAAMIIERFHLKHILIAGTLLSSLSYGLQVFFKDVNMILLFSFAATMFITVYRVSVAPFFMRNSTPSERIYLFSLSNAIMMLSQLIGFFLGGFLPKLFLSLHLADSLTSAYRLSLYTSIGLTLISIIPFLSIEQRPVPRVKTNFLEKIRSYDWKIIIRLMIPKIFVGMGAGLVIPFMNLYFKMVFGLESDSIGIFFSILQVFMFFGMLSAPFLTKRFGMIKSIVLTELASVPFMFILAVTRNLPLAVAAFILRGTLMNMNIPISSNFEMELVKEAHQPFTNAISMLAWNGAWTVSAHWGGKIIEEHSFSFSFFITITLYVISAVTYYYFFRNRKTL